MLISLIVPCYNEEEAIPLFYKEVKRVLDGIEADHEILFINDGSKDATLEILRRLSREDSHVCYLSFSRNFGKEAAMYAGFCNVRGDYAAVMDVDLQDPPDLLVQMMDILRTGEYDSVAARRCTRRGEPLVRSWFAKKFYELMNTVSDTDIVDGARDFRLMKREMVDTIRSMAEYNRFSKGIFGWIGFRTCWISYENVDRAAGKTKWSFWKLFRYAVDGVINFSQAPLNVASWFGIFMTVVAFVCVVIVAVRRLVFGDPVAGWASLVCIITMIGGIQLFCLGIAGQYISKIYLEVKKRPHYIVAESSLDSCEKYS